MTKDKVENTTETDHEINIQNVLQLIYRMMISYWTTSSNSEEEVPKYD